MSPSTPFPRRVLPDGRTLEVVPLTFGRGRLCVTINSQLLNAKGKTARAAKAAALQAEGQAS